MGAIKTLLSFEELERLKDEHEGKTELLEGELFLLPPPKRKHNRLSKKLFLPLNQHLKDCKKCNPSCQAGEVLFENGYLLGRHPGTWIIPGLSITWAKQPGDA